MKPIFGKDQQPKAASVPEIGADGWRVNLYAPWEDYPWIRIGWIDFPTRDEANRYLIENKHLELISSKDEAKAHQPI